MQPMVANLRPLFLLRGGKASVADFDAEARRATQLSVWLKPGAYLLTAAAMVDAGLSPASTNRATDQPAVLEARYGFVDNTLTNSMLRRDLAGQPAPASKPADDWIASMLRGKYAPIATALKDAESSLVAEGKLPERG